MSWLAPAKAMAKARAATTQGVSGWLPTPARQRVKAKRVTWAMAAQPRRLPSRPSQGGTKRSMSGDQRNLKVQGAWARVIKPTTRISMPIRRIQSGMAVRTRANGRPEENERSVTEAVRHEVIARPRLGSMPRRLGGVGAVTSGGEG